MDFYKVLEVDKNASLDEIKKKRNDLALRYHPDKLAPNEREKGDEMIKKINQAYETLSDPVKRQNYDTFGTTEAPNPSNFSGFANFGGIFNMFSPKPSGPPKAPDPIIYEITIDINDICNGTIKTIPINRNIKCEKCDFTGFQDKKNKVCPGCNGKCVKERSQMLMPGIQQTFHEICRDCLGTGSNLSHETVCKTCKGTKINSHPKIFTLNIEKGLDPKKVVRVSGEGHVDPKTGLQGDIIFTFKEIIDPDIKRKNLDLYKTVEITLKEAFGCLNKSISLPGSIKHFNLAFNNLIRDGEERVYEKLGVACSTGAGNLHIIFKYIYPDSLTLEQISVLQTIF